MDNIASSSTSHQSPSQITEVTENLPAPPERKKRKLLEVSSDWLKGIQSTIDKRQGVTIDILRSLCKSDNYLQSEEMKDLAKRYIRMVATADLDPLLEPKSKKRKTSAAEDRQPNELFSETRQKKSLIDAAASIVREFPALFGEFQGFAEKHLRLRLIEGTNGSRKNLSKYMGLVQGEDLCRLKLNRVKLDIKHWGSSLTDKIKSFLDLVEQIPLSQIDWQNQFESSHPEQWDFLLYNMGAYAQTLASDEIELTLATTLGKETFSPEDRLKLLLAFIHGFILKIKPEQLDSKKQFCAKIAEQYLEPILSALPKSPIEICEGVDNIYLRAMHLYDNLLTPTEAVRENDIEQLTAHHLLYFGAVSEKEDAAVAYKLFSQFTQPRNIFKFEKPFRETYGYFDTRFKTVERKIQVDMTPIKSVEYTPFMDLMHRITFSNTLTISELERDPCFLKLEENGNFILAIRLKFLLALNKRDREANEAMQRRFAMPQVKFVHHTWASLRGVDNTDRASLQKDLDRLKGIESEEAALLTLIIKLQLISNDPAAVIAFLQEIEAMLLNSTGTKTASSLRALALETMLLLPSHAEVVGIAKNICKKRIFHAPFHVVEALHDPTDLKFGGLSEYDEAFEKDLFFRFYETYIVANANNPIIFPVIDKILESVEREMSKGSAPAANLFAKVIEIRTAWANKTTQAPDKPIIFNFPIFDDYRLTAAPFIPLPPIPTATPYSSEELVEFVKSLYSTNPQRLRKLTELVVALNILDPIQQEAIAKAYGMSYSSVDDKRQVECLIAVSLDALSDAETMEMRATYGYGFDEELSEEQKKAFITESRIKGLLEQINKLASEKLGRYLRGEAVAAMSIQERKDMANKISHLIPHFASLSPQSKDSCFAELLIEINACSVRQGEGVGDAYRRHIQGSKTSGTFMEFFQLDIVLPIVNRYIDSLALLRDHTGQAAAVSSHQRTYNTHKILKPLQLIPANEELQVDRYKIHIREFDSQQAIDNLFRRWLTPQALIEGLDAALIASQSPQLAGKANNYGLLKAAIDKVGAELVYDEEKNAGVITPGDWKRILLNVGILNFIPSQSKYAPIEPLPGFEGIEFE